MFNTKGHKGVLNENLSSKGRVHALFTKAHFLLYHNAIELKEDSSVFYREWLALRFLHPCQEHSYHTVQTLAGTNSAGNIQTGCGPYPCNSFSSHVKIAHWLDKSSMYLCAVGFAWCSSLGPLDLPLADIFLALVLGETGLWQNFLLGLLSDACLLHKQLQII